MLYYSAAQNAFFLGVGDIPADAVELTVEAHRALLAGQAAGQSIRPGPDARPMLVTPPPPSAVEALEVERAALVLTDIQFALVAVEGGWMSASEAELWVGRGEIPAIGLAAIAVLPEAERSLARIRFAGARTIARLDPFVPALIAAAGASDAQADDMWRRGMQL